MSTIVMVLPFALLAGVALVALALWVIAAQSVEADLWAWAVGEHTLDMFEITLDMLGIATCEPAAELHFRLRARVLAPASREQSSLDLLAERWGEALSRGVS